MQDCRDGRGTTGACRRRGVKERRARHDALQRPLPPGRAEDWRGTAAGTRGLRGVPRSEVADGGHVSEDRLHDTTARAQQQMAAETLASSA